MFILFVIDILLKKIEQLKNFRKKVFNWSANKKSSFSRS